MTKLNHTDAVSEFSFDQSVFNTTASASELSQRVGEVFLALRAPVFRYVRSIVWDASDAEDLAQEAFIRLFHEARTGRSLGNVRAWVFRVAHNLAIDCLRKRVEADSIEAGANGTLQERSDPHPNAEQLSIESERYRRVRVSLFRLSPLERQCLELRAEGLRLREIGAVLGIHISTVQTALARAVGKIANEVI